MIHTLTAIAFTALLTLAVVAIVRWARVGLAVIQQEKGVSHEDAV